MSDWMSLTLDIDLFIPTFYRLNVFSSAHPPHSTLSCEFFIQATFAELL